MTGVPRRVSYQSRVAYVLARTLVKPVLTYWPMSERWLRAALVIELAAGRLPRPRRTEIEPVPFDDFAAEWVRAENRTDDGAVLYFHGGAFLFCGLNSHRAAVSMISAASRLPALQVAYRQLPHARLDGSVADCLTAYRWLLDQGYAPDRVVFAGDSAGGYLAYSTALAAADVGLPMPGGIVAVSPWLDLDPSTKLADRGQLRRDGYIPGRRFTRLVELCTGGAPLDRALSPVNRELAALPPSLIIVAESEVLRVDAELMASRLAVAGADCELQVWPGQVHAFPSLAVLPESRAAIREIGRFVRGVLARSEMSTSDSVIAQSDVDEMTA